MSSGIAVSNRTTPHKPFAPTHQLKPIKIQSRRKRMNELPAVSQEYIKPKVVLFYKNGDRNYRGSHVTVTPRRFRNFDNLLNELTRITNLAQGARYIFTPENGSRIQSMDQLADGKSYVCGSYPRLKKINYNHAPDGKAQSKKKVNHNFIPVPPASKLNLENSSSKLKKTIKPKIVNIIRNGVGLDKKSVKILLNKRTAQSYEQVLDDITSAVGVQGGFVKKLYNKNGKLVHSLSELFGEDDVFIAVGSEKFKPSSATNIIEQSGFGKARTQSQPLDSSKKEVHTPIAPKTSPTKMNKNKIRNTPYNKPGPLISHSKLPSIKKRQEPDGESLKNNSELSHINLTEDDIPDAQAEVGENDAKMEADDDKKTLLERKSSTSSSISKDDNNSDVETDTISVVETKSSNSDIPNNHNEIVHVDLPDNVDDSQENTVVTEKEKRKESSSLSSQRESSVSSASDKSDSDSEDEDLNKEKNLSKEHTSDSNLQSDINKLLDSSKDEKDIEKPPVYNERLTKVFNINSEIEEFYDIGKKLGDGNFAVVKEAIDKKNNQSFALKIIDASKIEGKLAMLNNEIKIQRSCSHPNIVQLYHDMHSPTQIFLVMELISGGDFFDLISSNVSFEEDEASGYMRDLCSGLDYLHQRGIVHRDIKPENLMVYESNGKITLKIADFGLAMKVTSPIFTICGTPTYVAPEILTEKGYGLEVDVWAAGVILYIMLCGFPPFRSPNRKQTELFDLIEKGEFEFLEPYWEDVSDTAKDLISNILVVDKKERLTAESVFKHAWLSQFGLDRNNTLASFTPKRSNRFKTTATGIQSIERMKLILKLEREKFITHVHHENDEKEKEENSLQTVNEVEATNKVNETDSNEVEREKVQEKEKQSDNSDEKSENDDISKNQEVDENNNMSENIDDEQQEILSEKDDKETSNDDSDETDNGDEDNVSSVADATDKNETTSKSRDSTVDELKSEASKPEGEIPEVNGDRKTSNDE